MTKWNERMTFIKRIMSFAILFEFILWLCLPYIAYSDSITVIPPQNLTVTKESGLAKIEVNQDSTIVVEFSWQYSGSSSDWTYFEFYISENSTQFNQRFNIYQNDSALKYDSTTKTYTFTMEYLPNNQRISNGMIYYARVRAAKVVNYEYGTVVNYSSFSNTISFLTPIFVEGRTNSETSIDVVWDDVYYNGERIDYDIFVSKDISFTTPTKYQIDGDKITVYQSQPVGGRVEILPSRQLKYTILNLSPSSLYYIKVVPRNLPSDVIWRDPQTYSQPNPKVFGEATTYIQADAIRLTQDIVKISWMSVSIAVGKDYEIYQGSANQIPYLIGTVSSSNNQFYRTVPISEEVFFRVQVDVSDSFGRNVTIRSKDLYVHPYTLPFEPPAAEDLTAVPKSTNAITIKFKIPDDEDVLYDFYYKKYSQPDSSYVLYMSNYQMQDSDVEKDVYGAQTGYYKVDISNLERNTVYVVEVVVKKRFFDYETNTYIYKKCLLPSVAVSYTLSGEISPPSVPMSVYVDGYTDTTVTISWDPIYIPGTNILDDSVSYIVNYAVYKDNIDLSQPNNLTVDGSVIISKPRLDNLKIRVTVSGLSPDTRYIFFVKSRRIIDNSVYDSLPSQVLMVTTLITQQTPTPSKPPMIDDLTVVSTTYSTITYSWKYIENIYYEVQITDNIQNANSWQTIADSFVPGANEINYQSAICYFTAKDLKPDTLYYLRVRTYIVQNNQRIYSDYSNTASAKTLKVPPPQTPVAFGIKDYGKDYAVFTWEIAESGRSYILEIADNISFTNSQKLNIDKDKTEFKVENLKPNTRYYARLFAAGSDGQLSSATYIVSFVTKKDVGEYTNVFDEIQDTTRPLETKEDYVQKTMVVEITYKYTNTAIDSTPISIDFTKRTNSDMNKFVLKIRYDVLNSLDRLNKECLVTLDNANVNFGFGAINVSDIKAMVNSASPATVYVELWFEKAISKFSLGSPASQIYDIQFIAYNSLKQINIKYFNQPITVSLVNLNQTNILPYTFNPIALRWEVAKSYSVSPDSKTASINIDSPQAVALIKKGGYRDIASSAYSNSLFLLFKTFDCDDDGEYIDIKKNVTKFELASYLVYYVQYKKLHKFEVVKEYVEKASKAGIIDDYQSDEVLTKEMMLDMLIRFYEVYTSNQIAADNVTINKPNISQKYLLSVKKAYAKGWILDYTTFNPKDYATREYVLATLYKVLTEVR